MGTNAREHNKRGAGVLCHITSLPSVFGIGDFGDDAYRFVEFLAETKQKYWQILPLNPTCSILGHSPYASFSAYAGNPLLISPVFLMREGFLTQQEVDNRPGFSESHVDYDAVADWKNKILKIAYERFKQQSSSGDVLKNYKKFESAHKSWLTDVALFMALKEEFKGALWTQWPDGLAQRAAKSLKVWAEKVGDRISFEKFVQYVFFKQWFSLKNFANSRGVKIIGDIPIYVNYDSCDVWVDPKVFKIDANFNPKYVSGVPPDYFSKTGQLWGNPVYDWNRIKKEKYIWWIKRFKHNFTLFDVVRLDHFRGFVGYWEVPSGELTAVNGKWQKVPAEDFFSKILKKFPKVSIIAEDLGHITEDVKAIMKKFHFPGMKLLLFAFEEKPAKNPYVPHNHVENCVIYTGTHDNNTVRGWFEKEARQEDRNHVYHYFGREFSWQDVSWEFNRLAMMSVAQTCILPLQDIIGLGEEGRMNRPGTIDGNWRWRFIPYMLSSHIRSRLVDMTELYGRA